MDQTQNIWRTSKEFESKTFAASHFLFSLALDDLTFKGLVPKSSCLRSSAAFLLQHTGVGARALGLEELI